MLSSAPVAVQPVPAAVSSVLAAVPAIPVAASFVPAAAARVRESLREKIVDFSQESVLLKHFYLDYNYL